MKQKTHSGLKKRIKVKKSGKVMVQKSCKQHLLDNKSKRQKGAFKGGMEISSGRRKSIRRLMPGKVGTAGVKKVESKAAELKKAGPETVEAPAKKKVVKKAPAKKKAEKKV